MNALALVAALLLHGSPDSTIRLSPGMQQTLRQPGVTKVAIADPSVADVQSVGSNGDLLLLGKRRGKTNLTVWVKGGKIFTRTLIVDDGKTSELERLIHETVNPVLEVKQYQDKVVIDGTVDSMEEFTRLKKVVGDDPNVRILVKLNPRVLPFVAQQITQAFRRNGIANATAVAIGGRILLEGSVADEDERQKAQLIADAYYAGWQSTGQ